MGIPLVWMDLEMSGLNPDKDVILEISTVITDNELNLIAQGANLIIHHEQQLFEHMDDWNKKHHVDSGLWSKVIESTTTLAAAEAQILNFLKAHNISPRTSPLCGNSIWQDRRFIAKYMANLDDYLHYRIVDVSSIKELVARWYPGDKKAKFQKKNAHRAIDDILESIQELKFYRENFFVP